MPGFDIRLLDADENAATDGEVAIALDPPPAGLMLGYQNDDGTIPPHSEAVYRTGDVASRDADGYYTYVGRADDVFKAADYRISPFELESVLIEHAAVAEAAVVPAPDPVRTAVPKAYIALAVGWPADRQTALAIFRHIRERAGTVQAHPPDRVRGAAEDHLRQDPPGGATPAGAGCGGAHERASCGVPRGWIHCRGARPRRLSGEF